VVCGAWSMQRTRRSLLLCARRPRSCHRGRGASRSSPSTPRPRLPRPVEGVRAHRVLRTRLVARWRPCGELRAGRSIQNRRRATPPGPWGWPTRSCRSGATRPPRRARSVDHQAERHRQRYPDKTPRGALNEPASAVLGVSLERRCGDPGVQCQRGRRACTSGARPAEAEAAEPGEDRQRERAGSVGDAPGPSAYGRAPTYSWMSRGRPASGRPASSRFSPGSTSIGSPPP